MMKVEETALTRVDKYIHHVVRCASACPRVEGGMIGKEARQGPIRLRKP